MKGKFIILALICLSAFFGCTSPKQVSETDTIDQIAPFHTPEVTPIPTNPDQSLEKPPGCVSSFQRRELAGNYQKDKQNPVARYTLSTAELQDYLAEMGVKTLCIPFELGAPFLNVDWDSNQIPATTGRMLSLGFENLYHGAGWSDGYILYATYDFSTGTEYETFAEPEDFDAVNQGIISNIFEIDGVKGFIRIKQSNICFGKCTAYKAYIFPFKTSYVAVVHNLGAYDFDSDWETIEQTLIDGNYPVEKQANLALMDFLVSSIQFFH